MGWFPRAFVILLFISFLFVFNRIYEVSIIDLGIYGGSAVGRLPNIVRAFTHELFNQSFSNFNMLLLMTKWRSSSIMTNLTFTVQELWFLKD